MAQSRLLLYSYIIFVIFPSLQFSTYSWFIRTFSRDYQAAQRSGVDNIPGVRTKTKHSLLQDRNFKDVKLEDSFI